MASKAKNGLPAKGGQGGETHQTHSAADGLPLTTNQGLTLSDNQNSLKAGDRGPTLLEDFILREKITHFDHERIPERIVHARGSGAHGYFTPTKSCAHLTKAGFLQELGKKTEVFVRFSTVAGGAGSIDLARDVRGFAVKFYTEEGNFDLVGNNIPVFFIQDAIKFPDLIHSVKMEPDRGFPQAASAHDTFWDFVSLMPESIHMLMWTMSDRAIPRSYRMMEGFGVNTFRLVAADGTGRFVKFHWRPTIGATSVIWDEAVKINGADHDFHRRDLWEAIEAGQFPEYEFAVQVIDESMASELSGNILDATKLVPEEIAPLEVIGRMVLDQNPDNFFAETEQVAFHPGHVVPGIEFSDDPLLQGRLFSYTDTQLIRLGGPNFHEIPVNRARCPMHNFQRDGIHRIDVPKGRVAYEPNSLDPAGPRENPKAGFATVPEFDVGPKVRVRSESFSDHYTHARLFFRSMTPPEQRHIIGAFSFELAKVETPAIRERMVGHLSIVEPGLAKAVAENLGLTEIPKIEPVKKPKNLEPSPALSLVAKAPKTLRGRKVGILVTDGVDDKVLSSLLAAIEKEGAQTAIIAPKVYGVTTKEKKKLPADQSLTGAPSCLFDAVALLPSKAGAELLADEAAAIDWIRDAFGHLKIIGHSPEAQPLFDKASIIPDEGVITVQSEAEIERFINTAKAGKLWDREPELRSPR